ncbi:MAG TPA: ureidoglycolate lyase [Acidimicrobiales bacterium]|nr:ureidoglycolate lyase [Acidimicrobiales bacterium]
MGEASRRIEATAITEADWAPFGWLPVRDTDPHDGEHRLEFTWGDPHVNVIGHTAAEIPPIDGGLRCRMLYRHDTHTQTLMALDHRSVIAVAPADVEFTGPDDAGAVRAFVLEPLEPLVLGRGTWHWGPFPIRSDQVTLFNVQGLRYAEDNRMADLDAVGATLDVIVE